jgi:hypothetical protein
MVLGIAMLITVIGIGALATARITTRATGVAADWVEAGEIAFSAVEHAIAKLNSEATSSPATWRSAYTNGTVAFDAAYGRGRMKWVLVDEEDGLLIDDYGEDLKVYGVGKVGTTMRVYSVTLTIGGPGLDVLRTVCHTSGNMKITNTAIAIGGPVSANGDLELASVLRGTSEIAGTGGTSSPAKTMPMAGVFDYYASLATWIPSSYVSSGDLKDNTLSAADNPFGAENAQGIYIIQIPESVNDLKIQDFRTKATLLIEGASSRTDQEITIRDETLLESNSSDLPTLITKRIKKVTVVGSIKATDTAPFAVSEIRGLMHCIGTTFVTLQDATHIRGTLICDGYLEMTGTVGLTFDPKLLAKPPEGYTTGNVITPVPGTWKWDAPPAGI